MKFLRWARPAAALCVSAGAACLLASCGGGYTIDYLYVVSGGVDGSTGNIAIFAINNTYGGLSSAGGGTTASGGNGPSAAVATHDGNSLFVANKNSGNVAGFKINQGDGSLTAGTPVSTPGGSPVAIATDTAADYLYVVDNAVPAGTSATFGGVLSSYKIASGGSLTLADTVLLPGTNAAGVATSTDGSIVVVTAQAASGNGVVESFTSNSGVLSQVATVSAGQQPKGIAIEPTNRFVYAVDTAGAQIISYGINSDGTLSPLVSGTLPTGALAPVAITIEPRGRYVYVANANSSRVTSYSIQLSNGALSTIGTASATGTTPVAITVDPLEGIYVYTANNQDNSVTAFKLTTSTGQLSGVQNSPFTNVGAAPTAIAASPKGSAPIPGQP